VFVHPPVCVVQAQEADVGTHCIVLQSETTQRESLFGFCSYG